MEINNAYRACSIIEGFDGIEYTEEEIIHAYAFLVKTGIVWTLQGFYGRNANSLIDSGIISKEGEVL